MMSLDLQTTLFVLLLLLLMIVCSAWWLRGRNARRTHVVSDAWDTLAALPFGVAVLEYGMVAWANEAAHDLLPHVLAVGADGLLHSTNKRAARSGRLAQPVPLRWCSQPLDDQRALLVLIDEREQQRFVREQQAFVSQLSHELRAPLTALVAHSTIARDPNTPMPIAQASLATIQREAERMARLVRDLLELYRLETADDLPLQPTNLLLVAEESIASVVARVEERDLQLALEAHPHLPRVLAHPDRLKQVFVNLLDNAVKYCHPGDSIRVRLQEQPEGVLCEVQDSGAGIPSADLPHVVERLYRGRTDVEGSGIGLALVSEILHQHGTTLTITSVSEGERTGTTCAWVLQRAAEGRK